MNSKLLVGLVVLLVGVGAGWYFLQGGKSAQESMTREEGVLETPTPEPTTTLGSEVPATGTAGAADKGGVPSSGSVTGKTAVLYGTGGFVPNTLAVKIGTTVVWTNQSQGGMWVASAMHPTHQLLPGFDELKSVSAGGAYEYTFEKVGTWKYHNHVAPADTGTVVVTE
ncbi:MAG: hypothetical protein AAB481_00610 [Patescibacteria group bacterium]